MNYPAEPEAPATPLQPNRLSIDVDGTQRATTNSLGNLIHWSEEGVRNFWRWFGPSAATDEQGRPLMLFHGTYVHSRDGVDLIGNIESFDRLASVNVVKRRASIDTVGSWFSDQPGKGGAEMYGNTIYPVHLAITRPHETTFSLLLRRARLLANGVDDGRMVGQAEVDAMRTWLKEIGKDGIKVVDDGADDSNEFKNQTAWIALEPEQIKSAIGNYGLFSSSNSDIRFSRTTAAPSQEQTDIDGSRRPMSDGLGLPEAKTDEAFKAWFGQSKVIDEAGKPLVVYHGTPNGGFSAFSHAERGTRTGHAAGDVGFHFTDSPSYAEAYSEGYKLEAIEAYRGMFGSEPDGIKLPPGASTYPVLLKLENPYLLEVSAQINAELIAEAKALGHDGIIADMGGAREFVVFEPTQIKSAIGNNGDFSPSNADIRFSLSKPTENEAFLAWFGDSKVVGGNGEPLVVYHGTPNSFSAFDTFPAYFTPDSAAAYAYASGQYARDDMSDDAGPNVMPAFLRIRNPIVLTEAEALEKIGEDNGRIDWTAVDGFAWVAMDNGHDGLIIRDALDYAGGEGDGVKRKRYDQYIVMSPNQIKSAIGNNGQFDPANPDIRFQRTEGLPLSRHEGWAKHCEKLALAITSKWKAAPPVVVAAGIDDPRVPAAIRDNDRDMRAAGADGAPEGVYYDGAIYLFADAIRSDRDLARVLFHEGLGHHGLRAVFGSALDQVLARVIQSMPGEVERMRVSYGLSDTPEDLLHAAEEVLAYLAEKAPALSVIEQASATIRTWLRTNIPAFADLPLSREEIIRDFIIPAREHVIHGGRVHAPFGATLAGGGGSRAGAAWRIAFHGSPHREIKAFSTDQIGTGEGAQAFGWGLYFAGDKGVADHYRRVLSGCTPELEARLSEANMHRAVAQRVRARGDEPLAWEHETRARDIERLIGQLYEVEIPDDAQLLDADLPMHRQSPEVHAALNLPPSQPLSAVDAGNCSFNVINQVTGEVVASNFASRATAERLASTHSTPWMNLTGRSYYEQLSQQHGGDRAASEMLAKLGVPGLRYLDGNHRAKGDGHRNYVIFDDRAIQIRRAHFSRASASKPEAADQPPPRRRPRPGR